jgi:hypothetical protein
MSLLGGQPGFCASRKSRQNGNLTDSPGENGADGRYMARLIGSQEMRVAHEKSG